MSKDVRRALQVARSVSDRATSKVEASKRTDRSERHPALDIPGTHVRHEIHGEPVFTGED